MLSILERFTKRKSILKTGGITQEVLPVFHDRFKSTNKTFEFVDGGPIETQNGVPIKFEDKFLEDLKQCFGNLSTDGDLNFIKNGLEVGNVHRVHGVGFMSSDDSIYEVMLVTDKYVYLKEISRLYINIKSHSEIETMRSMGTFTLINSSNSISKRIV